MGIQKPILRTYLHYCMLQQSTLNSHSSFIINHQPSKQQHIIQFQLKLSFGEGNIPEETTVKLSLPCRENLKAPLLE